MKIKRRKTRKVMVGDVPIGGNSPITVQSMTNTLAGDEANTIKQALMLQNASCDIIRVSFPSIKSTSIIPKLKKNRAQGN